MLPTNKHDLQIYKHHENTDDHKQHLAAGRLLFSVDIMTWYSRVKRGIQPSHNAAVRLLYWSYISVNNFHPLIVAFCTLVKKL